MKAFQDEDIFTVLLITMKHRDNTNIQHLDNGLIFPPCNNGNNNGIVTMEHMTYS